MWTKTSKDGKTVYCERYVHPITGKKHDVSVTYDKDTARNRKDAIRALQVKIDKKIGLLDKTRDMTLRGLVTAYLEEQEKTHKPSTVRRNKFACEKICRILDEDAIVNRLDTQYIRTQCIRSGESMSTLNELMIRFKALIRWAYENNYIQSKECIDRLAAFHEKDEAPDESLKYLEPEELKLIIEKGKHPVWTLMTEALALSGLRCGELIALTAADIDLKNMVIHVRKTYDSNNHLVTTAKTLHSMADVNIQPQLLDCIKRIQSAGKRRMIAKGIRSDLLFFNDKGEHINYYSYRKWFGTTTEKLLGRRLTPHALRHTHASILFAQGFTLPEVARRLRHGNSAVTEQIYLHVIEQLKQRDAEKIRNVVLY